MTKEDVCKLFDLLKELHGKQKPKDDKTLAIWSYTLAPWTYEQVREAAVRRSRGGNHYCPDPSELAQFLPQPPAETPEGRMDAAWALPYVQKGLGAVSGELAEQYRAAGVQSWEEAQETGVSWQTWTAACRAAFSDAERHVIPVWAPNAEAAPCP